MKTVTIRAQQKWDYCVESRKTETYLLMALNELGRQGWELVGVHHHKDPKGEMSWTAFLKRPNAGPASPPGQETALSATSLPSVQAAEKSAALNGFDLSGDEFALKGEVREQPAPAQPSGK
jgi:hypothetical protein